MQELPHGLPVRQYLQQAGAAAGSGGLGSTVSGFIGRTFVTGLTVPGGLGALDIRQ